MKSIEIAQYTLNENMGDNSSVNRNIALRDIAAMLKEIAIQLAIKNENWPG